MSNLQSLPPDELERRLIGQRFALDVETEPLPQFAHLKKAGLRWYQNRPIGIGFSCKSQGVQCYVTLCSPDVEGKWVYDEVRHERVTKFLWRLVDHPQTEVIFHNAKFDTMALNLDPNDSRFQAGIHDTALMIHLLDSREKKALEWAEQRWLGTHRKADHLKPHHGKREKVNLWPFEQAAAYCTDDAIITEELFYKLAPQLGRAKLVGLYQKEIKFSRLLWAIERRGVRVDLAALHGQAEELTRRQEELEQALYAHCGYEFNWRATAQLSKALYEDLGIPKPVDPDPGHRHAMSKYYTEAATSTKLLVEKVRHPAGGILLALREAAKLRTTLIGGTKNCLGWSDLVDDEPALHTSFNQTNSSPDANSGGTRSGRLSSTMPNLQNIANVTRRSQASAAYGDEGVTRSGAYLLRNVIVSRPGTTFVAVDSQQQEARLLALLSGEERMIALFARKSDLYADVAELIWGVRDPVHRRWAKDTTLAINYGMNEASLAEYLSLPREQAHDILVKYFTTFPRIPAFLREVAATAKAHGAVRTWEGRLWRPANEQEVYKGVNALVQGGAAGLFSIAALRIARWLREHDAGHIVLLIHDEVVLETPDDLVSEVAPVVAKIAEVEDIFGVVFPQEVKIGRHFGEMEKWATD